MTIDWGAFAEVFVVSLGSAVGVMALFALGVTLIAGRAPAAGGAPDDASTPRTLGPAVAVLCFLACGAVVLYGLYILVS